MRESEKRLLILRSPRVAHTCLLTGVTGFKSACCCRGTTCSCHETGFYSSVVTCNDPLSYHSSPAGELNRTALDPEFRCSRVVLPLGSKAAFSSRSSLEGLGHIEAPLPVALLTKTVLLNQETRAWILTTVNCVPKLEDEGNTQEGRQIHYLGDPQGSFLTCFILCCVGL